MKKDMQQVLFVFGCQRSGTTATIDGLKQIETCHVFDEENSQTNDLHDVHDKGLALRLKPTKEVIEQFGKFEHPLLICKPLVESQHAAKLLAEFPNSKAIWMLRNYRDVAASMLKRWDHQVGFTVLHAISDRRTDDWRSENVGKPIETMVHYFLNEVDLQAADAAALFWWIRNSLFFQQNLHLNDAVRVVQYETTVTTEGFLARVFDDLGIQMTVPPNMYHSNSIAKGKEVQFQPEVKACCEELYQRMLSFAFNAGSGS